MSLSKNAIGNLINRYKAVLKKCHLLNTFGSLALASALLAAVPSVGMAAGYEPTLDRQSTKVYLGTLTYDDDEDPATEDVKVYSQDQINAISSAYVVEEVTDAAKSYYTTFTVTENGAEKTYGVLLKGQEYDGTTNTDTFATIKGVITSQKSTVEEGKTGYYTEIKDVTPAGGSAPADGTYTFSMKDPDNLEKTLYFAMKKADGTTIASNSLGIKPEIVGDSYTGNFILNKNIATHTHAYGGAIYNDDGSIITGDFLGNSAIAHGDGNNAYGGGVYNSWSGVIGSITSDFLGNSAIANGNGDNAYGGAIYNNTGDIITITGDFLGNSAIANGNVGEAFGGAISNRDYINRIIGNFFGNSVTSTNGKSFGGAIYSDSDITTISGDFIGNSATVSDDNGDSYGGAIYNDGNISSVTGDFLGNSTNGSGNDAYTYGGAIYNANAAGIGTISGDFIDNSATTSGADGVAYGGAIYNGAGITAISGDFIGNSTTASGSYGTAYGGAIYNHFGAHIDTISGDFLRNSATAAGEEGDAFGGAIYNGNGTSITTISGYFFGNSITVSDNAFGGAIYNKNNISSITGNFLGNSVTSNGDDGDAYGGAICNDNTITTITGDFIGNSATSTSGTAYGGAIYTEENLTFTALDGDTNTFSGNFTQEGSNAKNFNAIYVEGDAKTLTFTMQGDGGFVFNDNIRAGDDGAGTQYTYTVDITGVNANNNIFSLNNTWYDAKAINITNATLELGSFTHESKLQAQSIYGTVTINDTAKLNVKDGDWQVTTGSKIIVNGSLTVAEGATLDSSTNGTGLQSSKVESIVNNGTVELNYANLGLVTDFSKADKVDVSNSEIQKDALNNLGIVNISGYNNVKITNEQYDDIFADLKSFLEIEGTINLVDVDVVFTSISSLNHITNDATADLAKQDETLTAGNLIYGDNVVIAGITENTILGTKDSTITNGAALTLTGNGGSTVLSAGSVSVNKGATLTLGHTSTPWGEFTFDGDITVDGTETGGKTASLVVDGMNVTLGATANKGANSLTLTKGADLTIDNNGQLYIAGLTVGDETGSIDFSDGTLITIGGTGTNSLNISGDFAVKSADFTTDKNADSGIIFGNGSSTLNVKGDIKFTDTASANLNINSSIIAQGASFGGNDSITITLGSGTVSLSDDKDPLTTAPQTFTGSVKIDGGNLIINNGVVTDAAWGDGTANLTYTSGGLDIGNNTTLNLNSFTLGDNYNNVDIGEKSTIAAKNFAFNGSDFYTLKAEQTFKLVGAGASTDAQAFAGKLEIDGGTLQTSGAGTWGDSTGQVFLNNGTVSIGVDAAVTMHLGTLNLSGGTFTLGGTAASTINANTYITGLTTLAMGNADSNISAKSFEFDADHTLERGTYTLVDDGDATATQNIDGNLTLNGAGVTSANLNIAGGVWTLAKDDGSNKIIVSKGTLSVGKGATLDLSGRTTAGLTATSGSNIDIDGTVKIEATQFGTFDADLAGSGASEVAYEYQGDAFTASGSNIALGVIDLSTAGGKLVITGLDVLFATQADQDDLISEIIADLGLGNIDLSQIELFESQIDVFTSLTDVSESAIYDYVTKTLMAGDLTFVNTDTTITPNKSTIIAGITVDDTDPNNIKYDSTVKGAGVKLVLSGWAEDTANPGTFGKVALSKGDVIVSEGATLTLGYNGYADASKTTKVTPPSGLTLEGNISVDSADSSLTVKYTDVTLGDTVGNATHNLSLTDGADLNVMEGGTLHVATLTMSDTSIITMSDTSTLSARGFDLGATAYTHAQGKLQLADNAGSSATQSFKADSFTLKGGSMEVSGSWEATASTSGATANFTIAGGTVNIMEGASFDISGTVAEFTGGTIAIKGGQDVATKSVVNLSGSSFGNGASINASGHADVMIDLDVIGAVDLTATDMFSMKAEGTDFGTLTGDANTTLYLTDADVEYIPIALYNSLLTEIAGDGTTMGDFKAEVTGFTGSINIDHAFRGFSDTLSQIETAIHAPTYTIGAGDYGSDSAFVANSESTFAGIYGTDPSTVSQGILNLTGGGGSNGILSEGAIKVEASSGVTAELNLGFDGTSATDGGTVQGDLTVSGVDSDIYVYGMKDDASMGVVVEGTTTVSEGGHLEVKADGKFNAQAVVVGNSASTGIFARFDVNADTTLTTLTIEGHGTTIVDTEAFNAKSVTVNADGIFAAAESNIAYDADKGLGIDALTVADGGAVYVGIDKTLSVNNVSFAGDVVNFKDVKYGGGGTLSANCLALTSTSGTTIKNATVVTKSVMADSAVTLGDATDSGNLHIVDNGDATAEWTADAGEHVSVISGTLNLGFGTTVDLSKVTFTAGAGAVLESALGTSSNLMVGLTAVGLNADGTKSADSATVLGADVDEMRGTVSIVGLESITIDAEDLSTDATYQSLNTQAQTSFGTKANIDYGTITFINTKSLTIEEVAANKYSGLGKSEVSIDTGGSTVGAGETAHVGTVVGQGDIEVEAGGELSISGLSEDGSTGEGTVLLEGDVTGAGDVGLGNSEFATTLKGSITAGEDLEVNNVNVDGNITHGTAGTPANGAAALHNVTAKTVSLNNNLGSTITGTNRFEVLNVETSTDLTGSGTTTVEDVTLGADVDVSGGHAFNVSGKVILTNNLNVGFATDTKASSASFVEVDGAGQYIVVDPAWKDGVNLINDASSVAIGGFVNNEVDARLVAGQNSFIVLGTDDKQWALDAFAQFNNQSATNKLEWGNGSGQVSAALFIKEGQELDGDATTGGGILVDGLVTAATADDVVTAAAQAPSLTIVEGDAIYGSGTTAITAATVAANTAKFTANSLLVIDASDTGVRVGTTDVALKADRTASSTLTVSNAASGSVNDAKLLIVDGKAGTLHIASGFDNIDADSTKNNEVWDDDDVFFSSSVLNGTIVTTAAGAVNLEIKAGVENVGGYTKFQGETVSYIDNMLDTVGLDSSANAPAGQMLISRALTEGEGYGMGKLNEKRTVGTIEGAAQLAAVGNAAKGVIDANLSAGGAVGGRNTGLVSNNEGGNTGSVTLNKGEITAEVDTNGGNMAEKSGVGVWLTPLYKWNTGSGFEGGSLEHDYDMGLGGIALGLDFTNRIDHETALRFGLAFNVGAGYSDSTGDYNETNNDFDFWGLSLYGAFQKQNFVATLDFGFTSSYNDITQDLPSSMAMGDLNADVDAFAFSAGLNLEYTFNTGNMEITPHAGVRFMSVTTAEYDIESASGLVASVEEDTQNVWYFPVGVTFSADMQSESGWTFTPKLDLGFIAAAGDLEATSKTRFSGVPGNMELSLDNVDGFAFNGGLGFELSNEDNGISIGLNYNLQAGENETGHMIFANFRYDF